LRCCFLVLRNIYNLVHLIIIASFFIIDIIVSSGVAGLALLFTSINDRMDTFLTCSDLLQALHLSEFRSVLQSFVVWLSRPQRMQRFLIPSFSKSIPDWNFERCLGLTLGREVERFLLWALASSLLVFRYLKTLLTYSFALFMVVDFLESSRLSVFVASNAIAFSANSSNARISDCKIC
jgi:hypothetical protein